MYKNILKIVVVFIFGIAGGIFANQVLWPSTPVAVTEKKEVIIQENVALQDAVGKVEKTVVGIKTKTKDGKVIYGSGLIVTSDGLMITLAEILPKGGDFVFFVDNKTPKWQILKRDVENNLALVKLEERGLQACGFADFETLKLGERVFLIGTIFEKIGPLKVVNEGIVKFFTQDYIRTNIFEKNTLAGSPLFNIKGDLLGLNTVDSEGKITTIPVTKIRAFLGF